MVASKLFKAFGSIKDLSALKREIKRFCVILSKNNMYHLTPIKMKNLALLAALWLLSFSLTAQEEARLMRFPAIHGNQVAFSYAGDQVAGHQARLAGPGGAVDENDGSGAGLVEAPEKPFSLQNPRRIRAGDLGQ
jgi:hypothetical protein